MYVTAYLIAGVVASVLFGLIARKGGKDSS